MINGVIKIRKTFQFEDLGKVVSITTDLLETGKFGFNYIEDDEYCFSEKHVLKTEEGKYYTRTFYRSD